MLEFAPNSLRFCYNNISDDYKSKKSKKEFWAAVISTVISFAFTAVHRHFDIQQKGISVKVSYRDYALSVCIILLALVLYYWQVVQVIKLISVLLVVGLIIYINRDVTKYIKKMIKKKVDR